MGEEAEGVLAQAPGKGTASPHTQQWVAGGGFLGLSFLTSKVELNQMGGLSMVEV